MEELKIAARAELARIGELGGAVAAVDSSYMKQKLVESNLRRIAAIPEFRSRIEDTGGEVATLSLKESADYLQGEFTRWAKVVQDRNIKAD